MSEQETSGTEERQSPPAQLDQAVAGEVLSTVGTAVRTIIIDPPHRYTLQFLIAITRRRSCPDTASPPHEETAVGRTEEKPTSEKI